MNISKLSYCQVNNLVEFEKTLIVEFAKTLIAEFVNHKILKLKNGPTRGGSMVLCQTGFYFCDYFLGPFPFFWRNHLLRSPGNLIVYPFAFCAGIICAVPCLWPIIWCCCEDLFKSRPARATRRLVEQCAKK